MTRAECEAFAPIVLALDPVFAMECVADYMNAYPNDPRCVSFNAALDQIDAYFKSRRG